MLRDKGLVPLSHQHQHALALCVRIGKAFDGGQLSPDVHPFEQQIVQEFDREISYHFQAEEKILFPTADKHDELAQLIDALRIEHTLIRRNVERARSRLFTVSDLQVFAATLSEHIRKEERELFEAIQKLLSADELRNVGNALQDFFNASGLPGATCAL